MIPTIQELKKMGYKLVIHHYRLSQKDWKSHTKNELKKNYGLYLYGNNILAGPDRCGFGGKTHLIFQDPSGKTVETFTVCSLNDQFRRKTANQIVIGRALAKLALDLEK